MDESGGMSPWMWSIQMVMTVAMYSSKLLVMWGLFARSSGSLNRQALPETMEYPPMPASPFGSLQESEQ
jgi:hypothetical protein